MTTFEEANKVVHPVDKQWHYPIMTAHGYEAVTTEAVGFVRSYMYVNRETNHTMQVATGASADYWNDDVNNKTGYWGSLNSYLETLTT